jgi:hypothetical protein
MDGFIRDTHAGVADVWFLSDSLIMVDSVIAGLVGNVPWPAMFFGVKVAAQTLFPELCNVAELFWMKHERCCQCAQTGAISERLHGSRVAKKDYPTYLGARRPISRTATTSETHVLSRSQ